MEVDGFQLQLLLTVPVRDHGQYEITSRLCHDLVDIIQRSLIIKNTLSKNFLI